MDLISRQDAIDALIKLGDSYFGEDEVKRGIAQSQRIIYELPSAERTGRWESDGHTIACSNCHLINLYGRAWEYCPYCGTRMVSEE